MARRLMEMALEWCRENGIRAVILHASDDGRARAISLSVACDDQDEVDYYWENLVAGGEESMCGWLKDKFGLSWQVVPEHWDQIASGDPERAAKVFAAMKLFSARPSLRRTTSAGTEACERDGLKSCSPLLETAMTTSPRTSIPASSRTKWIAAM